MPNIGSLISAHNRKQLAPPTIQAPCNCRVKPECPLKGDCQVTEIVYEATVKAQGSEKTYIGSTAPPFKLRFGNHKTSLRHETYKNSTELSKHVWDLKEKQTAYAVEWRVAERSRAYSNLTKRCPLCTAEKARIIMSNKRTTINTRSELISKCRHANRFVLSSYTGEGVT